MYMPCSTVLFEYIMKKEYDAKQLDMCPTV